MKRSGIQRKARLQSSGPLPKRNAKRHVKNHTRAFGSVQRLEFVQSLPCANCGAMDSFSFGIRIANAHIVTGGTSQRADADQIIPLCETITGDGCHDLQHGICGGWSQLRNLDTPEKREAAAARTEKLWLAHVATVAPSEGTANAE